MTFISPDKREYLKKYYYFSTKTCGYSLEVPRLAEALLMSTYNISFCRELLFGENEPHLEQLASQYLVNILLIIHAPYVLYNAKMVI